MTEHGLSFCRTKFVTPQNGGPCCAGRICSDNWLNHRHITSLFINLIYFIWTLSLHEKERLNRIHEMLQNGMYSYFEIMLSFNFITLNSCGITAVWIYYVFFTQRIRVPSHHSICWNLWVACKNYFYTHQTQPKSTILSISNLFDLWVACGLRVGCMWVACRTYELRWTCVLVAW